MADDVDIEELEREDTSARPGVPELLDRASRDIMERMHTAAPGVVHSSDSSRGVVAAQQAVTRAGEDPEPTVTDVPVMQMRGSLGGLRVPVSAGDATLLIHSNRSLDEWNATDGSKIVEAADTRAHDATDAVAIPCMPGVCPAGAESAVVLDGDDVRLGTAAAVDAVIKGTALKTAIAALPAPTLPTIVAWCVSLQAALSAGLPLSTKVKVG